jgi:hypothetical protein
VVKGGVAGGWKAQPPGGPGARVVRAERQARCPGLVLYAWLEGGASEQALVHWVDLRGAGAGAAGGKSCLEFHARMARLKSSGLSRLPLRARCHPISLVRLSCLEMREYSERVRDLNAIHSGRDGDLENDTKSEMTAVQKEPGMWENFLMRGAGEARSTQGLDI